MFYSIIILSIVGIVSALAALYFTYLSVMWSKKRYVITHEIQVYLYGFCALVCYSIGGFIFWRVSPLLYLIFS